MGRTGTPIAVPAADPAVVPDNGPPSFRVAGDPTGEPGDIPVMVPFTTGIFLVVVLPCFALCLSNLNCSLRDYAPRPGVLCLPIGQRFWVPFLPYNGVLPLRRFHIGVRRLDLRTAFRCLRLRPCRLTSRGGMCLVWDCHHLGVRLRLQCTRGWTCFSVLGWTWAVHPWGFRWVLLTTRAR